MNRDELLQLLRSFEAGRPSGPLDWKGVDFWPLIRPFLGMELHKTVPFDGLVKPPASLWSRRAGVVRRMLLRFRSYRRWIRELDTRREQPLLITRTDRRRLSRGKPFHRMATPLRGFLAEMDLPLNVWEFDAPPFRDPTAIPTQGFVQWRWMFAPERRRQDPPPAWFDDLAAFLARPELNAPASLRQWPFWRALFGSIIFRAGQYGRWLEALRPRIIFIDCWYVADHTSIILAARKLGIPTVDLQHGIQGASHFGYASWTDSARSPLLPGAFWFWGEQDRRVFEREDNALPRTTRGVVGGSLELNFIREHLAEPENGERSDPTPRKVLITEQKGIDIRDVLLPAMTTAGKKLEWLIRPHPGQERSLLIDPLRAAELRATLIRPGDETVFESLARADLHVTGFSSVALESLAMGVRTVLVHPAGGEIFRPYLDAGLMALATTPDGLAAQLARPGRIDREKHETLLRETFAPPESTRGALRELLASK